MRAKDLKNKGVKIELEDKEYEINFDMNTFCELEEIYGDINKAFDDLQSMKFKAIRALLYAAIKSEDETVTLKGVGKMLNMDNISEIANKIGSALNTSMPEKEDKDVVGE